MEDTLPVWLLDLVLVFFLLEWTYFYFHVKRHPNGLGLWELSFSLAPGFFLVLGFLARFGVCVGFLLLFGF
jgi:hypothetical protein